MISCKTEVYVNHLQASQVYDWFVNLDQEKYTQWHPDHVRYEIRNHNETYLGSTVYYEQKLEGSGANFRWNVMDVKENERLLFKAQFIYPIHLDLTMKNVENGVLVCHDLRLGFEDSFYSRLLDRFVRGFIFTERDQKINDEHVREEFKNLESFF